MIEGLNFDHFAICPTNGQTIFIRLGDDVCSRALDILSQKVVQDLNDQVWEIFHRGSWS